MNAITYCKYGNQSHFKAFDINRGIQVNNLIYATMIEPTNENKAKLQELADLNKDITLKIQLRQNKKIIFETT